MKRTLLIVIIFLCSLWYLPAQEDALFSRAIPVRNSLKFNRHLVNPTFSFVKEQNRYLSFTNQREWVQFEDAPISFLASYSGRLKENIGVGLSLFQQNYGILTSFGGILNAAYNARIQQDSNLTFGLNIGFFNSGVNQGKIITNTPDPFLSNIPSVFSLILSPGINYGTEFFDFGVSVNNLVQYNLKSSEIFNDDPEQSIQAHLMYTGYMKAQGFFDQSKFSTLIRSEFKKNSTIISGLAMLTVPKGIWGQIGYNTIYGLSAGVGLNITENIAIEYNFEKAIGNLEIFGSSHNVTFAYRFKHKNRYRDGVNDIESALVIPKRRRRILSKPSKTKQTRQILNNEVELDTQSNVQDQDKTQKGIITEEKRQIEVEVPVKEKQESVKVLEATKIKPQDKPTIIDNKSNIKKINTKDKLTLESEVKTQDVNNINIAEEKLYEIQINVKSEKERLAAEEAVLFEITHKDDIATAIYKMIETDRESKQKQQELLIRLTEIIDEKNKDLENLKKENDLSEQGIIQEPKPFKSLTDQNKRLETLKNEVDNIINMRNKDILEIEGRYAERLRKSAEINDKTNQYYSRAIAKLKEEQEISIQSKLVLVSKLEKIDKGLDFERKRRIKRASYDNDQDRYQKDRKVLNEIKEKTKIGSNTSLKAKDFDFGEERSLDNIQIVKATEYTEIGYYLVLAMHSDIMRRNRFIEKVIAAGEGNIEFFYDVNTSMYYIYSGKFKSIEEATKMLQLGTNRPYTNKRSIVKIEK